VLEETRTEGLKEVDSILRNAENTGNLGKMQSQIIRNQGRASLIGSQLQAGQALVSAGIDFAGTNLALDNQFMTSKAVRNSNVLTSIFQTAGNLYDWSQAKSSSGVKASI